MPEFVVTAESVGAALGVEWGCKYVLEGPDGTRVVFNDDTDEDFIGILSPESSGLDAPDVREDASDAVEGDGGHHGNFYYGRRPVVLQGTIIASSAEQRNERVAKLKRASNAMRADATLKWKPTGATEEVELKLRRQQPLRITKGFVKEFQLALVSASAIISSVPITTKETFFSRKETAFLVPTSVISTEAPTWTNPNNAKSVDATYATLALAESQTSGLLFATYSPSLPSNAQLTGIWVQHTHKGSISLKITTNLVQLGLSSTALIGNNVSKGEAWTLTPETKEIGTKNSLLSFWGVVPTIAQVNSGTFGVGYKAHTSNAATAEVDALQMQFVYAEPEFVEVENKGDTESDATITIEGPYPSPIIIKNETTGQALVIRQELGALAKLIISTANHTIKDVTGISYYNKLSFSESEWFKLVPGKNKIVVTTDLSTTDTRANGGSTLKVAAQSAYL